MGLQVFLRKLAEQLQYYVFFNFIIILQFPYLKQMLAYDEEPHACLFL